MGITITVDIPGHGTYSADDLAVDAAVSRFLPASRNSLLPLVNEIAAPADYSDVHSVSALLIVLASFHGEA